MEEGEAFFDPRPPIREKKSTPHSLRFKQGEFQVKLKEKTEKKSVENEKVFEPKTAQKCEYALDPTAIAQNILLGQNFKTDDPHLIDDVVSVLNSMINEKNKAEISSIMTKLDSMREDAVKIQFQKEELEFLELEIGFAQTDFNIFKHKMLAKETDLVDNLKAQIEELKEKHEKQAEEVPEESREELLTKQKAELEATESLAEERIKEFHKFIEAELKPYKAKLKGLKSQREMAQDKDILWRVKHPVQPTKGKDKGVRIFKPI